MSENVQKIEIVDGKRSGLATASMVLGILAIIGSWIPVLNIFSIIMGVIGLSLGIPALIIFLRKKSGSIGKTIVGLVLCSFAIIIAINMNNTIVEGIDDSLDELNGGKTEEILKNNINVTIGTYTTDGNEYYESGKLEITVKNKTDKKQTYTIKIEALDSEGTRIGTDTIYASDLGAGQTAKYDAFTFGEVVKLKTVGVTFKVFEVSKY